MATSLYHEYMYISVLLSTYLYYIIPIAFLKRHEFITFGIVHYLNSSHRSVCKITFFLTYNFCFKRVIKANAPIVNIFKFLYSVILALAYNVIDKSVESHFSTFYTIYTYHTYHIYAYCYIIIHIIKS